MNSLTSKRIISDARGAFDYYLAATKTFCRSTPLANGTFFYPEDTIQADAGAFAGIFTCVWRAMEDKQAFKLYYKANPLAFGSLAQIVTPNPDDAQGFTRYARFWQHDKATPVADESGMRSLCRTLRNGLAHFNFRYVDVAPCEYFPKIGLALPPHIPQPDIAGHYRIFICDWNSKKGSFMDSGSDTRMIETHFAHFRYHLFMFLARLCSASDHSIYEDVLTRLPIK